LTKNVHDELKCHLPLDDAKVEVAPQIIDNTVMIGAPRVMGKPQVKVKSRMVKAKVTVKKSRLERTTSHLYDLEDSCTAEKTLNIDLDLYQMEDF
jgi:hypothetical protein